MITQKQKTWAKSIGELVAENLFADMFLHPDYQGCQFTWKSWGRSVIKEAGAQAMMCDDIPELGTIAKRTCKARYIRMVRLFVNATFDIEEDD